MSNVYRQISLLYLRRKLYWIPIALIALLITVPFIFGALLGYAGIFDDFYSSLILIPIEFFFSLMIAVQLKDQFANPRARLIPNFRRPHLLLAFGFVIVVLLFLPILLWSMTKFPDRPFETWIIFFGLFSAIFAGTYYLPPQFMWIPWVAFPFPLLISLFVKSKGEEFSTFPVFVLFLSFFALASVFWRLLSLTEEKFDYRQSNPWFWGQRGGSLPPLGSWGQWIPSILTKVPSARKLKPPSTFFSYVRLWNYGFQWNTPWYVSSILFLLFIIALNFFFGTIYSGGDQTSFLGMLYWLPLCQLSVVQLRRPLLGIESLRPISRPLFLQTMGITLLKQILGTWLAIATALALFMFLLDPSELLEWKTIQVFLTSFCLQPFVLGLEMLLIRKVRNVPASYFVVTLAAMLPVFPLIFFGIQNGRLLLLPSLPLVLRIVCIAGSSLTLGFFLTWIAYKKWLNDDLD